MSSAVSLDVTGAVATLTLNRPDALNALNLQLKTELLAVLVSVNETPSIRALVLTGSGRAFCVGQDLAEHSEALPSGEAFRTVAEHYNPLLRALADLACPTVAAINGTAAGAGLGLALACDLRVGGAQSKYTTAFSGIGLTADSGLSWTLQRMVGPTKATELIYLSEPFTAEDAFGWGMLNRLVQREEVLHAATELATQLAQGPTTALIHSRRSLAFAAGTSLDAALDHESTAQLAAGATRDHQQAVASFLAKQAPVFEGR